MALFPKNPQRLTPYANFRFKVKWDNDYVLGVSKVSGLSRSTQVIQHREGGDPSPIHLAPGQTEYGPITLERGVSYDVTFEQWANKVFDWTNSSSATGENTSLLDFRKDITIEVYNEAGMKVVAYNIHRAWVSEFHGMSDLDGLGNALVVESIVLQNEGWERDDTITDQAEPSFVLPAKNPLA
jgi:phage tail-like protein